MRSLEEFMSLFPAYDLKSAKDVRFALAHSIDQTNLNPSLGEESFFKWIDKNKDQGFASLCLPQFVAPHAVSELQGSPTKVCTTLGFPHGNQSIRSLIAQAQEMIEHGVGELDMLMNYGQFKEGKHAYVFESVTRVYQASLEAWKEKYGEVRSEDEEEEKLVFKVILETSELSDEQICEASDLVSSIGVDFVKTSSGFSKGGANLHDVQLMFSTVEPGCHIKASGGIRTLEEAYDFLEAGASRLGTSKGLEILEQFDKTFG